MVHDSKYDTLKTPQSNSRLHSSHSHDSLASITSPSRSRSYLDLTNNSLIDSLMKKDPFNRLIHAASPLGRRFFGNRTTESDDGVGSPLGGIESWAEELLRRPPQGQRVANSYSDRTMIDWAHEDRKERTRLKELSLLPGLHGLIARLIEITWPWIGVVLVGAAVGLVAGCLDILTQWLSDLRNGRCGYAFYLNKSVCCSGFEPHEICYEWRTWSELFNIHNAGIAATFQYLVYISTSVAFAGASALLVKAFAPFAFHTGIPEIKVILSGYVFQHYLSAYTLIIKAIGLAFAVASGLSLGKEGPLVHVACCVANLLLYRFKVFRTNEARKREMLSAAVASGVSVAFGAPLGGVLFVLEEISLASLPQPTLWRSFVCAVVATMTLQSFNPFKSGKLVLFQVQSVGQVWRAFELIPWVFLGLCGGFFGAAFIRANMEFAKIRRSSNLVNYPIGEVLVIAGFTAITSYLLLITRVPIPQLVEALFMQCSTNNLDTLSLCDSTHILSTVTLLVICAISRALVTSVTFGIQVPSGIFLPTISIGACFGRAVGIVMNSWQQAYPRFWLFAACPPEGICISPPVYAVIGAASAVGGLTRMTVSLVVIIFELTGAVELVLQIMMAVMIAKFTADYFSTDGIYEAWIHFHGYPYLSPKETYRQEDVSADDVMIKKLVSLSALGWTLDLLEEMVQNHQYKGFPIVTDAKTNFLMGYIPTNELRFALAQARSRPENNGSTPCQFFDPRARRNNGIARNSLRTHAVHHSYDDSDGAGEQHHLRRGSSHREDLERCIDLNKWVDEAPLTLEPETSMEIVAQYFQRLGLKNMLFTSHGKLVGMLTMKDLHKYFKSPFYSSS
ncbi:hypothetical protein O181_016048 [Austropuccinia psidii MF-1]|uniref:Chloride channel protein n=1 Tax=Austropuccinia psidii MF-1 TaxID=1389203 RepID=A0A9Q3GQI1_9BASI|nr:hypothetical protein [Austropuccinia psidii MF-1]